MTDGHSRYSVSKAVTSHRPALSPEVLREGSDVAIVASGALAETAVRAAQKLGREGISAKVISGRRTNQHDAHRLHEAAQGVKAILILEENNGRNGTNGTIVTGTIASSEDEIPTKVLPLDTRSFHRQNRLARNANADAVVRTIVSLTEHVAQVESPTSDTVGTDGATRTSASPFLRKIDGFPETDDYFGFPEESLQRERDLIRSAELSPNVESWFRVYSQVGYRTRYLWQWCVHGAELTTISDVLPEWRRHVCDTKVLSIMLCVLLDDVADEQGNEQLLDALMQIVEHQRIPEMGNFSEKDRECAEVTLELSRIYEDRVCEYPLYDVYKRLLHFDLMQYFNTMRYSCLLNKDLNLLNVTEHELYLPHAMHMMSFSTLDLMCTPNFQVQELGRFRESIWHAQCMGRVGNLLSTWRREIAQTDFTSGVFARAVIHGDLSVEQLNPDEAPAIEAAVIDGGHEQYFLNKWYEHRDCLETKVGQIDSMCLDGFLESQERFFYMHLACRGAI